LSDIKKKKNSNNKSGDYSSSKNTFQSPMVNPPKNIFSKTVQKNGSYTNNRKETKYAAISFSNERSDDQNSVGKEPATGVISIEKIISKVNQEKISVAPYEDADNRRIVKTDTSEKRNMNPVSSDVFFG
jgi:hypothetical protein